MKFAQMQGTLDPGKVYTIHRLGRRKDQGGKGITYTCSCSCPEGVMCAHVRRLIRTVGHWIRRGEWDWPYDAQIKVYAGARRWMATQRAKKLAG